MSKENLPTKRVVIAGCRDYNNYDEARTYIDFCLSKIRKENNIIILSGGAKGADSLGERYAAENGFEIERYPADWTNIRQRSRTEAKQTNGRDLQLCDLLLGRKKRWNKIND